MTTPWCERQRQALRVFRQAIVRRATCEREVAEEAHTRTQTAEERYAEEKQRIENEHTGAQADALAHAEQARLGMQERHGAARKQLDREYVRVRDARVKEYDDAKASLEAEFRDARWTTRTVYDADKRVAREQLNEATASSKALLKKLLAQWRVGRKLIETLRFLKDIPPLDLDEVIVAAGDPWQQMQTCAEQGAADLHALETLGNPHFINGWKPWLILSAVWLVLTLPGVLGFALDFPNLYWLLGAVLPAVILPIGGWYINRVRRRTNARIIDIWLSLRHAAHLARKLRPICLRLAKKTYLKKKRHSFKRNRDLLRVTIAQTKTKLDELREKRDIAVVKNEQSAKKRLAALRVEQSEELQAVEATLANDQQQATERYETESRVVEAEYAQARDENHRWHTQTWTALLRDWKSASDQFTQVCRSVAKDAEHWFPPLTQPLTLPGTLPLGLPIGQMRWTLEMFDGGVPQDSQLPRPELGKITYPALLPFPERASLLVRAFDDGKPAAIDLMHALLLRCWTAMPAGKVRCTIIDAVGRGENFSAFMHLVDHDEKLVDYRIWTELNQIDERLTNLTVHMENVLQKYLRNQYETLAEYNAQAGEVAEPFHFLVVAHFPINFSEDAARRLVSLASAGARCGIYTFVLVDTKQPMPHGFNLSDLENVCTILQWHDRRPHVPREEDHHAERDVCDGRFVWEDTDFSMFPLELEKMPPAERCTELLKQVGDAAVRSSKVEVPFEWIMPVKGAWWDEDSAKGIRVPIGRFGAQGKQLLELGQGTSQHVLVAGKTGSGKSTLLHVLITQLAMFYSPREVELYLIDFKKGVEFKAYANSALPHARVIAVESEREFGLSVLQRLDAELSKRGEIYRTAGVNDLASYREYSEKHAELPHLARIVLIVDEFQEFFIEDDKLAQESSLLLDRLVRQGRAFGMHVLLGSQTIGGAYSLARSTIDQMAVRIALQCSEADAHLILSRDNTEARLLSRPGEGIYNAMHGMLEGNHLFQVVWLNDNKRDDLLRQVHEMSRQREDFLTPIVFEGAIPADLTQNQLLVKLWKDPIKPTANWRAWLGDAVAIKDPTAAVFRKQSGSNVMILGQQEEISVGLTVSSLISMCAAVDPTLAEPSVHLVIGQALDAASEELVKLLTELLPIRLWPQRELGAMLNQLAEEIERRGASPPSPSGSGAVGEGSPQFLVFYGLQRLRDLRRPDDDFGYSKKGEEKTPYRQFAHILKEGPPVGVFTMLWCDTFVNLQRSIDRPTMREFDQRVLMQMSSADSSTLMDSPVAAKLGPQRALFFTEDQGKIEKFRPYALPSVAWIKSLQAQRIASASLPVDG